MVLQEQLVRDVPSDQVTLGAWFRTVTVGGLEFGVPREQPVAPYLVGLVNRRESAAQPNRGHRGLAVHAAGEGFLDKGVSVGMQTVAEEGLHLSLADATVHAHRCETGTDPAPGWVAGRGVVVAQGLATSALVITR